MSLACSILKSAAIQLAYYQKKPAWHGAKGRNGSSAGAYRGSRDTSLSILQTHLMDCPKGVRKEIGKTIRQHLNLGGAQ